MSGFALGIETLEDIQATDGQLVQSVKRAMGDGERGRRHHLDSSLCAVCVSVSVSMKT